MCCSLIPSLYSSLKSEGHSFVSDELVSFIVNFSDEPVSFIIYVSDELIFLSGYSCCKYLAACSVPEVCIGLVNKIKVLVNLLFSLITNAL